MKTYNVTITETLQRTILVEADNEQHALNMVQDDYNNENIVLDYSDFKKVDFDAERILWEENISLKR